MKKPYNDFSKRNGSKPKTDWVATAMFIVAMIAISWVILMISTLSEVGNVIK